LEDAMQTQLCTLHS